MEVSDHINYICSVTEKSVKDSKNDNIRILDGIGEVEINGTVYQAQIVLESNKKDWVVIDKPTIRVYD